MIAFSGNGSRGNVFMLQTNKSPFHRCLHTVSVGLATVLGVKISRESRESVKTPFKNYLPEA